MKKICEAETIEEQETIWKKCLRPLFVEGSFVQRLVDNPIFLWNALGVSRHFSFSCHGFYYVVVARSLTSKCFEFTILGSEESEERVHERRHGLRVHSV